MIRGCRKRMVIVSGLKDSSIEAAYFVLKDSSGLGDSSESDIIEKANSIIENCREERCDRGVKKYEEGSKKKKDRRGLTRFVLGFILGGITCGALIFLIFM